MGSSESTRRITLERGGDEGRPGIVKVSERVVRRLKGDMDLPLKGNEEISTDDLNQLWQELQQEKAQLVHQKEHFHQILHRAFEEGRKVEANRQASISSQERSSARTGNNLNEALEEKEDDMKSRENKMLMDEIQILKKKQQEQDMISTQKFNEAVDEVKKKFSDKQQPEVCQHLKNDVINCYKKYPGETLRCSQHVQEFMKCVKQSRMANLQDSPL